MNGELRHIRLNEIAHYLDPATAEVLHPYAQLSHPLLVGMYGETFVCMLGFIPKSVLADEAFLWMNTSPAAEQHKVALGRWARRLMPEALKRYPHIYGFCGAYSEHWLRSLGAQIDGNKFVIEASHG